MRVLPGVPIGSTSTCCSTSDWRQGDAGERTHDLTSPATDARAAIDWYVAAFGRRGRPTTPIVMPDGGIGHVELPSATPAG